MAGKKGMKGGGGRRNGSGRKKGVPNRVNRELAEMAREHTEEGIAALVAIMQSESSTDMARIAAISQLLDRGHGKPRQSVEHTIKPLDLTRLSDDDLDYLERLAIRIQPRGAEDGEAAALLPPPEGGTGRQH